MHIGIMGAVGVKELSQYSRCPLRRHSVMR